MSVSAPNMGPGTMFYIGAQVLAEHGLLPTRGDGGTNLRHSGGWYETWDGADHHELGERGPYTALQFMDSIRCFLLCTIHFAEVKNPKDHPDAGRERLDEWWVRAQGARAAMYRLNMSMDDDQGR